MEAPRQAGGIECVILAGSRPEGQDPLSGLGVAHKGLLELCGKPMIRYVVEALTAAPHVGQITIMAPEGLHSAFAAALPGTPLRFLPAEKSPATSVAAALKAGEAGTHMLVTTCDHPLLTAQMVAQFVDGAMTSAADVAAACVTQERYRAVFGDAPRTFIRFSDMAFSGANLFLLNRSSAGGLIQFWTRLEANRKRPLKMAQQIGLMTGLRYLLGRLSKAGAFKTLKRKTGAQCALVALEDAQAAVDVDKPADIALVEGLLETRHPAA